MKRFKNLLLVCDRDSRPEDWLDRAVTLARSNEAEVTIADFVESGPDGISDLFITLPAMEAREAGEAVLDFHRSRLADIAAGVRRRGIECREVLLEGIPFVEIIRQVLRGGHDLVIKGAGGPAGGLPLLFASTDLHLLRKCPCPVWVMKPGDGRPYERILAAIDPDPDNAQRTALTRLILDLATSLAQREGSALDIVHVWRLAGEDTLRHSPFLRSGARDIDALIADEEQHHRGHLDAALEGYAINDRDTRVHLVKGEARSLIPQVARNTEADLVVMGTVGRTGIGGVFIGNTAEAVLNQVDCSVLAVKPPGFESPVTLDG